MHDLLISELKDYKAINGHCNVPIKTHKELGKFVMNQRQYYKAGIAGQKNSLTPERINDLEEVRCIDPVLPIHRNTLVSLILFSFTIRSASCGT